MKPRIKRLIILMVRVRDLKIKNKIAVIFDLYRNVRLFLKIILDFGDLFTEIG